MTGEREGRAEEADQPDPSSLSAGEPPVRVAGPAAVPSVGVWVGPADEPARYERLEQVGGGAEGTIWRALRRADRGGEPEVVALKEYRPPNGAPADWPFDGTWRQIREQAYLLRGLPRTDHLVRVREELLGAVSAGPDRHDPRKAFHTPFVVMEWIEGARPDVTGGSSAAALATRLGWIRDLADAVDLLHSVSRTSRSVLVHGDIKPGNCLVTADRGLVLVDTGALQPADGLGDHRGLRSPPYAAPEVLAHPGRQRGTATDLYSLGAVAFFLLTGEAPASAEHPRYAEDARRALLGWAGVPERRRAELAGHVLRLLDPDPQQRTATTAGRWARELTRIVSPAVVGVAAPAPGPARRRTLLLSGLGAVVLLGGALLIPAALDGTEATPPPAGTAVATPDPTPTEEPAPTDTWPSEAFAGLGAFDAGGGEVVYEQDFTAPSPDWPAGPGTGYETAYTGSGYQLHVTDRGEFRPAPGPPVGSPADEVVSATAEFTSGQGAWGVWCRGVDPAGSRRYEFLLSHAGAVQIAGPDGYGTGWMYVEGLDMTAPVTLSARCADVVGAPVQLTLAVNGRTALTFEPNADALLGPGYAGIEGMTFSDVEGPTVTATYSRFDIRRAAT